MTLKVGKPKNLHDQISTVNSTIFVNFLLKRKRITLNNYPPIKVIKIPLNDLHIFSLVDEFITWQHDNIHNADILCFAILHLTSGIFIQKFRKIQCSSSRMHARVLFCFIETYKMKFSTLNFGVEMTNASNEKNVSAQTIPNLISFNSQ